MKKRVLPVILVLALIFTVFAGCSSSSSSAPAENNTAAPNQAAPAESSAEAAPSAGGKVQVQFWSHFEEGILTAVEEFNANNPDIEVVISDYGDPAIIEALVIAAATMSGPDLFYNWGGNNQQMFYKQGFAIDLTEYAEKYGWQERFKQSAWDLALYDDKPIIIPYFMNAMGIVYRKSAFEAAGVSVPTTYAELTNVCNELVKNGIVPFAMGGKTTWHTMRWTDSVLEQFCGPDLHDQLNNMEVSWDRPEVVAAYEELAQYPVRGWVDESWLARDASEASMQQFAGDAAMSIEGDWYGANITEAGLDESDFGFFVFPIDNAEGRLCAFTTGMGLTNVHSKEATDAAAAFLDYLMTPEGIKATGFQQIFGVDYTGDVQLSLTASAINSAMGTSGAYQPVDCVLPQEAVEAFWSIQSEVMMGDTSPADAAKKMQAAIESAQAKE